MALSPEKTVFRLRRCPGDRDISGLQELLSNALQDVSKRDIRIQSLATDYGVCNTTKTATLMFRRKLPSLIANHPKQTQWKIPLDDGLSDLLIDTHFAGFTPLNDPKPEKHKFDCIVISGLASHPFGSWQPKGNDKTYMWIRDTLPRQLPYVRAILYGYDTTLVNSYSFQSIPEVATTLINHLMPAGWQSSEMKPLVFLAHSLGGIVLKEMMVSLNNNDNLKQTMLRRARGGILFGVPSQGMAQATIQTMVKGRPNEKLVAVLAKGSPYLHKLDAEFARMGLSRRMVYYWAYETKESPTIEQLEDGRFSRTGPRQVLVTRDSATRGLWTTSPDDVFPIDEDHSELVKFQDGSSMCEQVVLKKLEAICSSQKNSQTALPRRMATVTKRRKPDTHGHSETRPPRTWELKDFQDTLLVPEWDGRFNTIEERSPDTLEWFMDGWKTDYFHWRQKARDAGLFWIHGKPGSGKSTLMKFIATDSRVEDYLIQHDSEVTNIKVRHFFHERGTVLQKSFEGMLKSILYQMFQALPSLFDHVKPLLQNKPHPDLHTGWTVSELQRCLHFVLSQNDNNLRIFIILDALDEYDGSPEFIAKFINELTSTAGERTCIKFLVSSRTSTDFLKEVGDTPQITLEDYNHVDIVRYCQNRMSDLDQDARDRVEDLIMEIVDQSQGVFMWAKLVLEGLISAEDSEHASRLLQSLPPDLSDYYTTIIQSIKGEDRRDAYLMFQFAYIMANPDDSDCQVHFMDLIRALAISRCRTYHECRERLDKLNSRVFPSNIGEMALRARTAGFTATVGALISLDLYDGWLFEIAADPEFIDEQIKRISDCSGGLIQILRPKSRSITTRITDIFPSLERDVGIDPWTRCVQFSHQTVKDFVENPRFKHLILDDDADLMVEDGYTFLAMTYLTRGRPELAHTYCHLAEETTGHSLVDFVKSMDEKAFKKLAEIPVEYNFQSNTFWCGVMLPSDPITFAISYDLPLCLEDLIRKDPGQLKTTDHTLLIGWPFFAQMCSNHCRIIKRIIQEGYTVDVAKAEFQDIMWVVAANQYTTNMLLGSYHSWLGPFASLKAGVLLEMGQDPNVLLYGHRLLPGKRVRAASVTWRPLHVADTDLSRVLLQHSADVNLVDGEAGNTPLDWMLAHEDTPKGRKKRGLDHIAYPGAEGSALWKRDNIHGKIKLLIRSGGTYKTTEAAVWQRYLKHRRKGLALLRSKTGQLTEVTEVYREEREKAADLEGTVDEQESSPAGKDADLSAATKSPTESIFSVDSRPGGPMESVLALSIYEKMFHEINSYEKELEEDIEEIEAFVDMTEAARAEEIVEEVAPRRLSKFFSRLSVQG